VRTLDYAVLGLVALRPSTGYDVAARMRRPVGYYWAESHGGIYPSLRRLAEAGWLTVEDVAGPGPRGKREYTVTAAGRRALGEWAVQPPEDPPARDELVLKVSALWAARPTAAIVMLEDEARRWAAQRAEYAGVVAALEGEAPEVGSASWFGLMTARRGVAYAAGRRDWCRQVARGLSGDEG
jgi:DNA-binding PadR family transcriptional regulator